MKTETRIKLLFWIMVVISIIVVLLGIPLLEIVFIEAPFYFWTGRNLFLDVDPGRIMLALGLFVVDMLIVLLAMAGIDKFFKMFDDVKKELWGI